MIVELIYHYHIKEEDGVGTRNDAVITAARALDTELQKADSTDDVCLVFTSTKFLPETWEIEELL